MREFSDRFVLLVRALLNYWSSSSPCLNFKMSHRVAKLFTRCPSGLRSSAVGLRASNGPTNFRHFSRALEDRSTKSPTLPIHQRLTMSVDYLLHESSVGYAIFQVVHQADTVGNRLKEVQNSVQVILFQRSESPSLRKLLSMMSRILQNLARWSSWSASRRFSRSHFAPASAMCQC